MAQGHRRQDLQDAAETKLQDASLLLQNGRFSNAYYLVGYAVELGFKACIARRMVEHVIPDKNFIGDIYTHVLTDLVKLAGLKWQLDDEKEKDAEFAANWGIAGSWNAASRYEFIDQYSAQITVEAVGHPDHGVMQWIRRHW